MKTKTLVKSAGAAFAIPALALMMSGSGAGAYPIDTTTTSVASGGPTTTVASSLPETGSSGVGESTMLGASIAILGGGLVLVSRRRREPATAA